MTNTIPFSTWEALGGDEALEEYVRIRVNQEREACAKECLEWATRMTAVAAFGATTCARAIRARGQA